MTYRILVPLDGSSLAEAAIPVATDIARRAHGSVELLRVHVPVVPLVAAGDFVGPIYDPAWDDELRSAAEDYLSTVARRVRKTSGASVSTMVRDNASVAEQVEESARRIDANLIVMTTHGRGGTSLAWFGSVADSVLRHTSRLTLIVPEAAANAPFNVRHVLVCLDGSRAAEATMYAAANLAALYSASLSLVEVVAPPLSGNVLRAMSSEGLDRFDVDLVVQSAKDGLDEAARRVRKRGRTVTTTVIVDAHPALALLDYVRETSPDVIAMGTHGRGLSRLFIGSVVDKVMRGSGRPTLVQRITEDGDT